MVRLRLLPTGVGNFASDMLGFLYPALASAKAAIQKDEARCKQWLAYWAVLAALELFQDSCEWLVQHWLPFYFELKIAFICWLVLPRFHGHTAHLPVHPSVSKPVHVCK